MLEVSVGRVLMYLGLSVWSQLTRCSGGGQLSQGEERSLVKMYFRPGIAFWIGGRSYLSNLAFAVKLDVIRSGGDDNVYYWSQQTLRG